MKLYTYLDIYNPMVAWETAIGRICSVDQLEKGNVYTVSLRQNSLLKKHLKYGENSQVKNEFTLEYLRESEFPDKVSRLRGTFFFETIEEAKAAAIRWRVPHFKEEYLTEVIFDQEKIKYSKYDSEWITHNLGHNQDHDWMKEYLAGNTYGVKPLTEILVSGVGRILNMKLRQRMYDHLVKKHPQSSKILSMSCAGFSKGYEYIGQVTPYLKKEGLEVTSTYRINMRDFRGDSKLLEHIDRIPPIPESANDNITLPDLSSGNFVCNIQEIFELNSYLDELSEIEEVDKAMDFVHR